MSDIFYDRRGHEKYADEIIPLHQKGYFAILVKDEKVLLLIRRRYPFPSFRAVRFHAGKTSAAAFTASCMKKPALSLNLTGAKNLISRLSIILPRMPALSENTAFTIRLLLSMMLLPMVLTLPSRPGARRKTAMPPG